MKKYVVSLPTGKDYQSILYRGSYITIKNGEIFAEDAPIRKTFPKMFIPYVEKVENVEAPTPQPVKKTSKAKVIEEAPVEEPINTVENDDDVIIETT